MFTPIRSMSKRPPVAVEAETPIQKYERTLAENLGIEKAGLERRLGTTRAHRTRSLKQVIG